MPLQLLSFDNITQTNQLGDCNNVCLLAFELKDNPSSEWDVQ